MVEVREQAVEGGEVELSCLVPRSRPAATLRWYRDRKELKGATEVAVGWMGEVPEGAGPERRWCSGGGAWAGLICMWAGLGEERTGSGRP